MTSLFQQSISLVSIAIFQHQQYFEFTFHNFNVILELVDTKATQARLRCSQVEVITTFYDRHHDLVDRDNIATYHCQYFDRFKKQELFTLREYLSSDAIILWWSSCCSYIQLFVLYFYVSLRSNFRVVMSATISHVNDDPFSCLQEGSCYLCSF